jgi:hypothetical protein
MFGVGLNHFVKGSEELARMNESVAKIIVDLLSPLFPLLKRGTFKLHLATPMFSLRNDN